MKVKLVVVDGANPGAYSLRLPTLVGRSRDASLKVPAAMVSRRHCEIYDYEGRLAVQDLGSSNGTFVNNERIDEPLYLENDDLITIGPVTLRVQMEDAAASESGVERPASHDQSSVVNYEVTDKGSFVGINPAGEEAGGEEPVAEVAEVDDEEWEDSELDRILEDLD